MGEAFLKKQAKGFRHRHDVARDRFAMPNLLAAMRSNGTATDCKCRVLGTGPGPELGVVVVLRSVGGGGAEVICGNAVVGTVEVADVQALAPAFNVGAGVLRGTVHRGAVLGGLYTVRVTEEAP